MKSAVTISLVRESAGGPFVFWHDLEGGMREAAALGFDAVEIFPAAPEVVNNSDVGDMLSKYELKLAAVGTGAGWVKHRLTLTSPDPEIRQQAKNYIRAIIDAAGRFGAPAIIGSMQGRWADAIDRPAALGLLADALNELGPHAAQYGVPLLYEPLNRYETNLITTIAEGVEYLQRLSTSNVKLLADLFHMNIEEVNVADALRAGGGSIGHVHFVDSNRRPVGCGHTDFAPIVAALREIKFDGYVSAECFAYPTSSEAARLTIAGFRRVGAIATD